MRRFILLSVLLHAGLGLLLLQINPARHDMPLPGQPLELTLTTFSEPASTPATATDIAVEVPPEPPQPVTGSGLADTPAEDRLANVRTETIHTASTSPATAEAMSTDSKTAHGTTPAAPAKAPQAEVRHQDTVQAVRAALYSALQARFKYPRRARARGWEGTVVVSLRLMPDGALADVQLADSSGIPLLDRAAVHALARLQVPQAVAWLDGREMDMLIPVEYRLRDS